MRPQPIFLLCTCELRHLFFFYKDDNHSLLISLEEEPVNNYEE